MQVREIGLAVLTLLLLLLWLPYYEHDKYKEKGGREDGTEYEDGAFELRPNSPFT